MQTYVSTLYFGCLWSLIAFAPSQMYAASLASNLVSKESFAKEVKAAVALHEVRQEVVRKQESAPEESPLKSISVLRAAVEKNFNDDNQFTGFAPIISKDDLKETVKAYLEMWGASEEDESANLFIEKDFVGTRKILVVGDLHGAIFALLDLFDDWKAHRWLKDDYTLASGVQVQFLGDYVDRGQGGVEVLLSLMLLKLKNKSQVTLGRGNHEMKGMNESFACELRKKYGENCLSCFDLITSIYKTLPVATILAGGKSHNQEDLSYFLCYHGMLDEALAASLEEILAKKFSSTEPLFFCNSSQKSFVSQEVMWGDICQAFDPFSSDVSEEKPMRIMPLDDEGEEMGRPCSNQKWREERFEPLLKKGYHVKGEVRAHQHQIACGVVLDSKMMGSLNMHFNLDSKLSEYFENLKVPYGANGPYPIEETKNLLEYFYHDYRAELWNSWIDGLGKVPQFTLSAAYSVPAISLLEVSYLILTPGATPQIPWGIQKSSLSRSGVEGRIQSRLLEIQDPKVTTDKFESTRTPAQSASTSAAFADQARTEGSSSSATSASANVA